MPKRGKGKRFQQAKRSQPVQHRPATGSQAQPVSNAVKPVAPSMPATVARPGSATRPTATSAALVPQSTYIIRELKRIGILTGIIIIILVILAVVLS